MGKSRYICAFLAYFPYFQHNKIWRMGSPCCLSAYPQTHPYFCYEAYKITLLSVRLLFPPFKLFFFCAIHVVSKGRLVLPRIDQVFRCFPRSYIKCWVGTQIPLCTACFTCSPPSVSWNFALMQPLRHINKLIPIICIAYTGRTSGHCLGTFKTPTYSVSHYLLHFFLFSYFMCLFSS
jgi:hypothetical protein